eukprot:1161374-Pelagomonas_calceolata.AAC.4
MFLRIVWYMSRNEGPKAQEGRQQLKNLLKPPLVRRSGSGSGRRASEEYGIVGLAHLHMQELHCCTHIAACSLYTQLYFTSQLASFRANKE